MASTHASTTRRSGGVVTEGDGIRVDQVRDDVGVGEARRRFGGLDVPATLVGMLAALALTVLLAGLIGAAIGAVGYQTGLDEGALQGNETEVSAAGIAGGALVLFLSFLVGGWAAGRMARYDGARNGAFTALWAILLAAVLAAVAAVLGDRYNVFADVNLPNWFSRDALTVGAIGTGLLSALAMLLGGVLGGKLGERYHRRVDATIVGTRPGGVALPTARFDDAGTVRRR